MSVAEECLKHLQNGSWMELNQILSNNQNATQLADSTAFMVFENYLIDELKRHEDEKNENQLTVAARIFQIHRHQNSNFALTENTFLKLTRYLFEKSPDIVYAQILVNDAEAIEFVESHKKEIQSNIDNSRIRANLNIKVGEKGQLKYDKNIFNDSPQEKELFLAAKKVFPDSILLPNTALSTIIDPTVCSLLKAKTRTFFYKSTLDLCIVDSKSYMPEIFIELDSGWHDKPDQIEKDKMKDEIFEAAGLTLERLRKIKNKEMIEIFELYINKKNAS